MVDRLDAAALAADHRFRRDQRVDDGLLDGLGSRLEEAVELVVGQEGETLDRGSGAAGRLDEIGGRERQTEVARSVARRGPGAADSEAGAAGDAFELCRQKRRV